MRASTATMCEIVGGPRDGDVIVVPGLDPPLHLRVIVDPAAEHLYVWHPAARGIPDLANAELVILDLDPQLGVRQGRPIHRYLWPGPR